MIVESGKVETLNAPLSSADGKNPPATGETTLKDGGVLAASVAGKEKTAQAVRVVAMEDSERSKFRYEGVEVVLRPGVLLATSDVTQHFNPAQFNKAHVKWVARSELAKPMAVNMYSAFWTLMVCMGLAIGISLVTTPKPDAELKNLVMGLTPLPDDGPCPWYERPMLWATAVLIVLVAINIYFW